MSVVEAAAADVAIEMESYIRKEWIEAISAGSRSRLYFSHVENGGCGEVLRF